MKTKRYSKSKMRKLAKKHPPLVDDHGNTPRQRRKHVCGLHRTAYCKKKVCR